LHTSFTHYRRGLACIGIARTVCCCQSCLHFESLFKNYSISSSWNKHQTVKLSGSGSGRISKNWNPVHH